jgi:hypothetical protein
MCGVKPTGSSLTIIPGCGWVFPADAAVPGGATATPSEMLATAKEMNAEILRTTNPQTHLKETIRAARGLNLIMGRGNAADRGNLTARVE